MSHLPVSGRSPAFRNDLQRQFIVAMVLVAVVPLTILSAGLYYYNIIPLITSFINFNRQMLDRQLTSEQIISTRKLAQDLNAFFTGLEVQTSILSGISDSEGISIEVRQDIIRAHLAQFPHIRWMGSVSGLQVGESSPAMQSIFEDAMGNRIAFRDMGTKGLKISEPINMNPATGEPLIVLSVPPFYGQDGRNLFLVALPTIDDIRQDERTENSVFVVDEKGGVIMAMENSDYHFGDDISHLAIVQDFFARGVSEKGFTYRGSENLMMRGVLSKVDLMNWGLVTQRKPAHAAGVMLEMEQAAHNLMYRVTLATILGLFFIGLLAGSVGAVIAVRFTRPLQDILSGIDTVAKGDFSYRFRGSGPSDLQHLTGTLNTMIESIERHTRDLQQNAENTRRLFMGSVTSLVAAIDAKDPYTQGHSRRVQVISVAIGKQMGLSQEQLDELEISALMHDIGKLGVNEQLLKKPGVLSSEERELLERHPVLGAEIMRHMPMFQNMLPGMLHHHERWDGTGYPLGLVGQEIPLYGRIVAVADTFDAMTSSRPYQEMLTHEEARELVSGWSGVRYDPVVVQAFMDAYSEISAICNTISALKGVSESTRNAR